MAQSVIRRSFRHRVYSLLFQLVFFFIIIFIMRKCAQLLVSGSLYVKFFVLPKVLKGLILIKLINGRTLKMRKISAYARIVHYKELRTRKGTGADEILVKFMSL